MLGSGKSETEPGQQPLDLVPFVAETTALCTLVLLAALRGQGMMDSTARPTPHEFCFRGRPGAFCKEFAITELAYGRSAPTQLVDPNVVTWDLGAMRNVGPRSAVGGSIQFTTRFSVGLKARYRRWLSKDVSLDIAPGVTVYEERGEARAPALV